MDRHPSVQRRFDVSLHFYLAALGAGVVGSAIGITLATGTTGASGATIVRLRPAHLSLNLFGLVGLVIAGTLPFFSATEARVKMSSRATPRALDALLAWLAGSLVVCATGFVYPSRPMAAWGLAAHTLGLLALLATLPSIRGKQLRWAGPRLLQLAAGIVWWAGGVAATAVAVATDRPVFSTAMLAVLVIGGYAQILVASLAYLGPVLRGGGHQRLSAGFAFTRSWPGLVLANVAAAFALGAAPVAGLAVALWMLDCVVRGVLLLT